MEDNKKDDSFEKEKIGEQFDSPTKYKILVVEDERTSLVILEKLIHAYDKNIEVIAVDSASKGLYYYFTNRFDLVFLDIMMAHIDGDDFIKIVDENMKAGLINYNPNIIVQTSITSDFKLAILAQKKCVLNVIKKPITSKHIHDSLSQYLC